MNSLAAWFLVLACLGLTAGPASGAAPGPLAVEVTNLSEPVLCAEKDNVTLAFAHAAVRGFRIEATHPAYLSWAQRERQAPDMTACDMSSDPVHPGVGPPGKVMLYRERGFWVTGHRHAGFWRPSTALVQVGRRVEAGLHLLQVWRRRPGDGRAEEILVLYPQDGYWRARPFSPGPVPPTAFGSSFLIGPVEPKGRPVVELSRVRFDPATRSFVLQFRRGGTGTVRMVSVDDDRLVLDIAFDRPIGPGPFAMLRSMYVTESNNDVGRIAVLDPAAGAWREDNIMAFADATASAVWAGRLVPSRHNTFSPDHIFSQFYAAPAAVAK